MSLVRLSRIGLAVPPCFCITAAAFREHLEQNKLLARLKATVDELVKAESQAKEGLLSALRKAIIEAPMAEAIRHEIEEHYHKLGADYVAVRSSGTTEDLPGHSFAGQYDTYLGISNSADCIEAVKKCWASLWTLRAYEYRQQNGLDHLKIDMAVIVQSLIAADTSGVMFSVDPVKSSRSSVIIEACFGLGETLVSGKVTPDRFVVSKKRLKLVSSTISEKKIERTINRNGLVEKRNIPEERSSVCCLDKKQAVRLAKIAQKIEAEFGSPQDIEWAVRGTDIFFLQSRPVTTIAKEKSWSDRQVWSNIAAQEVLPDVVTPATLSIIESFGEAMFDPVLKVLCMDRGNHPYYDVLAGRVYFNANIWLAVIRAMPVINKYDFTDDTGSEPGLHEIIEIEKTMTAEDLPDLNFKRFRFFLKLPLLLLGSLTSTIKRGRTIIAQTKKMNEKWYSADPAQLSNKQIVENCKGVMDDFRSVLGDILYLFNIIAAYPALEIICSKWLPDERQCAKRLLAGLGELEDANSGLDLWRLALTADSNPQLREIILSNDDWQTINSRLARTKSGNELLTKWNEFMDRHGYHCRAEIELFNARWSETPDYILSLLGSYIRSIGKTNPLENHRKLREQREQLTRKCRKSLRNPIKRMLFNHLLARAQWGSVFRENIKCEHVRLLTAMRITLLELGRRLHAESLLRDPEDIFFLKLEEIESVTQGRAGFDVTATVAGRRSEYNHWQTITPPGTIVGRFDPQKTAPPPLETDVETLKGLAVSAGVVTGNARVILRADAQQQLMPGEILVAPFTDPGWTPYFVTAAAVVMDQGSLLSHGSIVAREYGIPAVVNVGSATKIIKTGQKIQVDGNRGVVRVLQ
jgi:phosphohistidine swiveling domain-containing protein